MPVSASEMNRRGLTTSLIVLLLLIIITLLIMIIMITIVNDSKLNNIQLISNGSIDSNNHSNKELINWLTN